MNGETVPACPHAIPMAIPSGAALVATRIATDLSRRTWSIGRSGTSGHCTLFLLQRGRATYASAPAPDVELEAPALIWLPRWSRGAFVVQAGGEGAMLDIKEDLVWRASGDGSVSQQLRIILDRLIVGGADRITVLLNDLKTLIDALVREASDPKPGGEAMIELHLGIILVHLWRVSGGISETSQRGAPTTLAQQFLQLVEIHYRDHLSVGDFALRLGVPRSSLHEGCLKARGQTPLALIHARLLAEARNRLATTDLPVEQVAFGLGFRDAAYFNRFFSRLAGVTPGGFRKTTERRQSRAPQSFAAWP